MSEDEKLELELKWVKKTIKSSDEIIERFYQKKLPYF
jgi:tRNA (guanosine-2'-O-)-methyltransferase